jgi:multiple sugar transport system permease protein
MATDVQAQDSPQLEAAGSMAIAADLAARRSQRRANLRGLGMHLLVGGVGLCFFFPVFWMLLSSVRTDEDMFKFPPVIIPHTWAFNNYSDAVNFMPFLQYFWNTSLIAVSNVIGTLFSCSLAAYAFSRVRWHGRTFVFWLVLSTMLLPFPVTMIPVYVIFNDLHLVGTFAPLILPSFFGSAFFIFLLRQFFLTLPTELDEAARIDGAGHLTIFARILLPLARPALAVVALLTFLNNWTDLLGPKIYLTDTSMYTLSQGMIYFTGQHEFHWGLLMATSVLFILPIVVVFIAAQKTFIQGITMTGLKG